MRIVFITPEFVTERYFAGGLANYVYRVSRALVERGHEAHVVVGGAPAEERMFEGIHLHRVEFERCAAILHRCAFGGFWKTTRALAFAWAAYRCLLRLEREGRFDVVQAANFQACGLILALSGDRRAITRVSGDLALWNKASMLRRNMDTRCLERMQVLQSRRSRHVFAPSRLLADAIGRKTGKPIQVIRTPFFNEAPRDEASGARPAPNVAPYVLYFGRYDLLKGFHILAQSLPEVFRRLPDCNVWCVGSDRSSPLAASMADYARRQCPGFEGRLKLTDAMRHDRLYPIIQGARLVVLPSLIDNLPNTLLEAIALGRPVVGTYGTSFDEVLTDGVNGFLVPPGDPRALAAKIVEAWNHPRLKEIGEAARVTSEEFALEKTVTELVRYYERVIGEGGGR